MLTNEYPFSLNNSAKVYAEVELNGEDIVELKNNLSSLGFGNFSKNPSDEYDSVTIKVVKEFQEYYNLPDTGEVDQDTLDKIIKVLNPPYQNGDRGLAIIEIKKDLTSLGFGNFPSNPSIFYGTVTKGVVMKFQETFDLSSKEGNAGIETLNKIDDLLYSVYRKGNSSEEIRQLKNDMTKLGFGNFPKNPSKNYGSVTEGVVKEFQDYFDLPISGIVDEDTYNKIIEILNPPYQKGDRGLAIKEMKEDLTLLGFGNFPSNPSIYYGSVTESVVKDFQHHYKLSKDGIAGTETLNKIDDLLNSIYKKGNSSKEIRQLKIDLTSLGFGSFPNNPSKVFGSGTEGVVKDFQQYYELSEDGIVGPETLNKIDDLLNSVYKKGNSSEEIR